MLCKNTRGGQETHFWRTGGVEKWTPDGLYEVRYDGDEPGTTDRYDASLQAWEAASCTKT